ncbi:restriction endonuclease subunit S [Pedobacter sp. MC2016-14]|uniref:restriction endonuclease subunit S n=1 Tax=Pedobacter sp. MC2016-14 TaxID=2897327 RepID=UPI001E3278FC|nr:restriction endonuclease subunit S [Pedobacter sp. MC2016-14]MCD0489669.1 restriction endonuclease subunit S [Pedobacter sp. MC2016-14]
MMKHNSYRDSELDWLSKVPSTWQVLRVKDITIKIGSGVTPKGGSEVYVDSGIPLLRSQNVYDDGLRIDDVSFIDEETHHKMKNSQLKPFDILINITGASIGRSCIVPDSLPTANINQHIIYIRMKKSLVPYVSYYFKSNALKEYINLIQAGSSKEALNMGQTLSTPILLPSQAEQTAIAEYLDTKTQAIDKKVSLLEKKIGYYQELRKSLINKTVTQGLDKNVKLKDSGIDWIGQIPEHWEVKRFKSFAKTIKGKNLNTSDFHFDNALPLLSLEYLRNESVKFDTFAYSADKSIKATKKDLIIVWDGAAVGEILKAKEGYISSTIAKIKFQREVSSRFFYFLRDTLDYTLKQIPTGMGIPHLNPTVLNNFPCPAPPLAEQILIAEFLEKKIGLIEKIITNIQYQATALKELRKTLINDVVTGKIKVIKD